MDILLYNISDPPEKVVKITNSTSYTTIENVRFVQDDSINIQNPQIKLNLSDELVTSFKYNYVKIPKLCRYYFIENISAQSGLVILSLRCDVLQSFHTDIRKSEQYVIRSEKYYNKLLVDPLLPMHSDHSLDVIPFGEDVYKYDCDHVILETIGKGGTVS